MPFVGSGLENIKAGDFYIEKYIKIGQVNAELEIADSAIRSAIELSEKNIVSFDEFYDFFMEVRDDLRNSDAKIFGCLGTDSLFLDPLKIGTRLVMCIQKTDTYNMDNIEDYTTRFMNNLDYSSAISSRSYIVLHGTSGIANNVILAKAELEMPEERTLREPRDSIQNLLSNCLEVLSNKTEVKTIFDYCFCTEDLLAMLTINSNMTHNDQDGRFLFEGTKMMINKLYTTNLSSGDATKILENLERMFEEQKKREENVGNPLGPIGEAAKFYVRTPIQLLKGLATTTDPNIGLSDILVKGAAMAGSLVGQKIDIPYKLASLSLLPAPVFNGVTPPIPPLTAYNLAMPAGLVFLGLEHLLKDLPYYQNNKDTRSGNNKEISDEVNPFFCELLPEEND